MKNTVIADYVFRKWSKADKYITTDDRIEYIRLDYYIILEEGATALAHKYQELFNTIEIIKSDLQEIDIKKEKDAFNQLIKKHFKDIKEIK